MCEITDFVAFLASKS